MVIRKSWVVTSLLMAVVTVAALGCAGATSGTARTIGPNDLPSLAGRWVGTITLPSGTSETGTWDLTPAGDYTTRAGAFSATGKAQVKDGGLHLTTTSTSGGGQTGTRTSTASLSETPDGKMVLTGRGWAESGPFNFQVTKQK
jgi:hypothetical protein